MANRTPREATWAFIELLQRAFSCVTPAVLKHGGGDYPRDRPHAAYLGDGDPIPLLGAGRLSLTFQIHYRIVREEDGRRGPWKVQVEGYLFGLDGADGREILAYHWHPQGRSLQRGPHLHLGAGARLGYRLLDQAHLPTGRLRVQDMLRCCITQLGVEARRDDWDLVLAESLETVEHSSE